MLPPGTRLGPYEILSLVGEGGMGQVFKARDTRLDRTVAIKMLPAALAADPVRRERFEREARTVSRLEHPHICPSWRVRPRAASWSRSSWSSIRSAKAELA
jgi:serine/threonine protein kinase